MMPDVFISYSRRDIELGRYLHTELKKRNNDVWIDWEDIPFTASWWQEIVEGIETSDNFVVILTPDSMGSPICHMEISQAIKFDKRIIPISYCEVNSALAFAHAQERIEAESYARTLLGETKIEDLTNDNWQFLASINWIPFPAGQEQKWNKALRTLDQALRFDIEYVKRHTRLLQRARQWNANARNESYLLTGDEIQEAEDWLQKASGLRIHPRATALHTSYIVESRQAESQRQQIQLKLQETATKRTRYLLYTVTLFLIIAGVLAFLALESRQEAIQNEEQAQSLYWASIAQEALQEGNDDLAVPMALSAARMANPSALAERVLAQIVYQMRPERFFPNTGLISPDGTWITHIVQQGDADEYRLELVSTDDQTVTSAFSVLAFSTVINVNHTGELVLLQRCSQWGGRSIKQVCEAYEYGIANIDDETIMARFTPVDNESVLEWDGNLTVITSECINKLDDSLGCDEYQWSIRDLMAENISQERNRNTQEYPVDIVHHPDLPLLLWLERDRNSNNANVLMAWNYNTDKILYAVQLPQSYRHLSLSRDGEQVLVFGPDISIYDAITGDWRQTLSDDTIGDIEQLALHPDGVHIVTSGDSLAAWNLENGKIIHRSIAYRTYRESIRDVHYSGNWQTFFTLHDDEVASWTMVNGALQQRIDVHHGFLRDAHFSPDGKYLYTYGCYTLKDDTAVSIFDCEDFAIKRLELNNNQLETVLIVPALTGNTFVFNADGTKMALDSGGNVIVYNTQDWSVSHRIDASPVALSFSPNGRYLAMVSTYGTTLFYDLENDIATATIQQNLYGVEIMPDNERVALLSDNNPYLSRLADGLAHDVFADWRTKFSHSSDVSQMDLLDDGSAIITASLDGTLILWDTNILEPSKQYFGHKFGVSSVAFSPTGERIMSGDSSGQIIIWARDTAEPVRIFDEHTSEVTHIEYHPSGTIALSADEDGNIILWRIDTLQALVAWTYRNRPVRALSCEERELYRVPPYCDRLGRVVTNTPPHG